MVEAGRIKLMDIITASFLASAFVWMWMSIMNLIDLQKLDFNMLIAISIVQYTFFGIGGFVASYVVSTRTHCFRREIGLSVGLGAWIISITLFLPLSDTPTRMTIIIILFVFMAGSYLGIKFSQRRKRALSFK